MRLTFASEMASFLPVLMTPLLIALARHSSTSATILYHPSVSSRYGLGGAGSPPSSSGAIVDHRTAATQSTIGEPAEESCSCIRRIMGRWA